MTVPPGSPAARLSLCGVVVEGGRYLVARRNPGGSQGGKWEFPGGKQEPGETSEQALAREFAEELSVPVTVGRLLHVGGFTNAGKAYRLEAWETSLRGREFRLTEHQELRWVGLAELTALDLSDSDRQVAEALAAVERPSGN
jgi:8-oxo-dGTP diphosphatase